MTMKVSEILFKAAELIEERGLAKGEWQDDETGCLCAEGAITFAAGLRIFADACCSPAGRFLEAYLRETVGYGDIPAWNDAEERTPNEIVSGLRSAATKAQEQGL